MSPSIKTTDRWNLEMKFFHFFYARGGHANDADTIYGKINFDGEAELLQIFEKFNLPLQIIPEGGERLISGRSYTSAEYASVYHPIRSYPKYQEPGIVTVWGIKMYLEVHASDISIHLSGADGDPWSVTEKDFRNALKFENECLRLGINLVEIER